MTDLCYLISSGNGSNLLSWTSWQYTRGIKIPSNPIFMLSISMKVTRLSAYLYILLSSGKLIRGHH